MTTLSFDVTGGDNEFLTASATFKYTLYEIETLIVKQEDDRMEAIHA